MLIPDAPHNQTGYGAQQAGGNNDLFVVEFLKQNRHQQHGAEHTHGAGHAEHGAHQRDIALQCRLLLRGGQTGQVLADIKAVTGGVHCAGLVHIPGGGENTHQCCEH